MGRTAPDPRDSFNMDGVQVPLGKGVSTNIDDTSLLYNEYPLIFISLLTIQMRVIFNNSLLNKFKNQFVCVIVWQ